VLNHERDRIASLERRLEERPATPETLLEDLARLADLYVQVDGYLPALETLDRLRALPAARRLSPARRVAFDLKAIRCRLAKGEPAAAVAQAREVLRDLPGELVEAQVRVTLALAKGLFQLGRIGESREHAERALKLAETHGDLSLCAHALSAIMLAAYREGDLAQARETGEDAVALFRRLGDALSVARVRNSLGLVYKQFCEWEPAVANLEAALHFYRETARVSETAAPLMNLGIVHQKRGDWDRAAQCYREAEQAWISVGDDFHLAMVNIGLGNVARLQRRFPEAESHLLAALERARRHAAQREEVLALEFLGELDFDRGRPEAAVARYHEALSLAARTAPEGDLVVELERRRAEALLAIGRLDEADRALDRAMRLARFTDDRLELAIAHRVAGELALARGQRLEARERWEQAVQSLAACRDRFELARVHLRLARLGEDPRAARTHALRACGLFAEVGASHALESAEAELARLMGAPGAAASRLETAPGRRLRAPGLVACSPRMATVERLATRAAATELSVLVTGETGTGKELVARTIHTGSPRAAKPFLAVNCGALRADLALSQLFGHRKGAFTGAHAEGVGLVEAAHGGTLFLDEAGELPLDVQVAMLRFLETGEYLRLGETQVRRADVRIIAATNRVLRGEAAEERFRRDLLYRLNEIEIRLPALRERLEDIVPLAQHFLAFYGGPEGPRLAAEAEGVLLSYGWPGNVRELENVMKRLAALHPADRPILPVDLLPLLAGAAGPHQRGGGSPCR
jgi:transcriptional regulator with AAA-type ATPase domain/Tfp pilus assembly protein PilF